MVSIMVQALNKKWRIEEIVKNIYKLKQGERDPREYTCSRNYKDAKCYEHDIYKEY